jgi:hypothetical protein
MDLDAFCKSVKEKYPDISRKADRAYDEYWNSLVEMEFSSYSWFESLANALNEEMKRKVSAQEYVSQFNEISQEYSKGESEVEKAIDVAFVENLYWQVPADKARPFWEIMPSNLKELYVGFHGRSPL